MRKGGRGFDRTQRIADLIQKSLAEMLLQSMDDERFRLVTVTGVTVTRDLAHAKVFVGVLQDDKEKIADVVQALNRSARSFRYHLARMVDLRVVPELKFVYDEAAAHGSRITDLIHTAFKKTDKNSDE